MELDKNIIISKEYYQVCSINKDEEMGVSCVSYHDIL